MYVCTCVKFLTHNQLCIEPQVKHDIIKGEADKSAMVCVLGNGAIM